jgi:hippurate hydrolase
VAVVECGIKFRIQLEDFACYRTHVPSFFYWVGSTPEGEEPQDLHKPLFHTDDTMLRYAAELYMASVMVGGQS